MLKKKIWANFQGILELFTQKTVNKLSKLWIWDPGSGKNLFRIPNPGVKKAPDPGSGSATLDGGTKLVLNQYVGIFRRTIIVCFRQNLPLFEIIAPSLRGTKLALKSIKFKY